MKMRLKIAMVLNAMWLVLFVSVAFPPSSLSILAFDFVLLLAAVGVNTLVVGFESPQDFQIAYAKIKRKYRR